MPEPTSGEPSSDLPQTDDPQVDAALRDLVAAPAPTRSDGDGDPGGDTVAEDLDAVLAAGEDVHRRLTARLTDLGT